MIFLSDLAQIEPDRGIKNMQEYYNPDGSLLARVYFLDSRKNKLFSPNAPVTELTLYAERLELYPAGVIPPDDYARTEWYECGKLLNIEYDQGGIVHREDGPASDTRYGYNKIGSCVVWFINGLQHRDNAPASMVWDDRGRLARMEWTHHGAFNKLDGPALESWIYGSPTTYSSHWFLNGKLHRGQGESILDGPAEEEWVDGVKVKEIWMINDRCHRIGGPADWYRTNNKREHEYWMENGEFHRADGPAVSRWNIRGYGANWYWRGRKMESWLVLAQALLPVIHAHLPQPIAEEIAEQFAI